MRKFCADVVAAVPAVFVAAILMTIAVELPLVAVICRER